MVDSYSQKQNICYGWLTSVFQTRPGESLKDAAWRQQASRDAKRNKARTLIILTRDTETADEKWSRIFEACKVLGYNVEVRR